MNYQNHQTKYLRENPVNIDLDVRAKPIKKETSKYPYPKWDNIWKNNVQPIRP